MRDGRIRALALSAIVTAGSLGLTTPAETTPNPDPSLADAAALPAAVGLEDGCDPTLDGDVESTPKRLIGQVTTLDHRAGRLILATRSGPVSLDASVDTMNELAVGDVLIIELTSEPDELLSRGDCL
jgi:hypothetical protein